MNNVIDKKKAFFCLIVVSMAYFWSNFHRLSMAILATHLIEDINITTAQIGTLGSMLFYIYGLTQIPFGLVADKFGSKIIIQVCMFFLTIGTFVFGTATNYTQLFIGRVLLGFAVSGFYIPGLSLIAKWFDIRDYSFYLGLFMAIGQLGSLLASAPFEYLLSNFDFRSIYIVFTAVTAIIFVGSLFLHEDKVVKVKTRGEIKTKPTPAFSLFVLGASLLVLAFAGARQSFQGLWGSMYYTSVFGFDAAFASIMLMIFSIGGIATAPLFGKLADVHGRYKMLIFLLFFTMVCWMAAAFTGVGTPMIVTMFITFWLGATNNVTIPNLFSAMVDYTKPATRSFVNSIVNACSFFGSAFYTQAIGVLFEGRDMNHGSFFMVFSIYAGLLLLATLYFMWSKNNLDKSLIDNR